MSSSVLRFYGFKNGSLLAGDPVAGAGGILDTATVKSSLRHGEVPTTIGCGIGYRSAANRARSTDRTGEQASSAQD